MDAGTWRLLVLRADKKAGGYCDIRMLRPDWWIAERDVDTGGITRISFPECGIDGDALVLAIEPCPPIADGNGHVVTATFHHSAGAVYDIRIAGEPTPIGVTGNHPIYSADLGKFVRADRLQPGDHTLSRSGPRRVISTTRRETSQRVFNLEVRGQHVYHVGQAGQLVHIGGLICNLDEIDDLADVVADNRRATNELMGLHPDDADILDDA